MRTLTVVLTSLMMSGCAMWPVADAESDLTVAAVQRDIRIGMSGAEVAAILGSPNIVTTDELRNEAWIYDRFSTERVQTDGADPMALLQTLVDTGPLGDAGRMQTERSHQKTLTVIIKFDAHGEVRDFAYHTSRF